MSFKERKIKKLSFVMAAAMIFPGTVFPDSSASISDKADTDFTMNGFREIEWDDSIIKFNQHLILSQEAEEIKLYHRIDERLSIGEATITDITYSFKNDRFSGVILHTNGSGNRIAIISELENTFGKAGRKPGKDSKFMRWNNKKIKAVINCGNTDICQIIYIKN